MGKPQSIYDENLAQGHNVQITVAKQTYKSRNNEDWSNYKKQRNFCTNLLKKSKENYLGELDVKHLNDSRKFRKIIKPFFSDKRMNSNKMMMIEKDKLLSEEGSIAEAMNNYFVAISKSQGFF